MRSNLHHRHLLFMNLCKKKPVTCWGPTCSCAAVFSIHLQGTKAPCPTFIFVSCYCCGFLGWSLWLLQGCKSQPQIYSRTGRALSEPWLRPEEKPIQDTITHFHRREKNLFCVRLNTWNSKCCSALQSSIRSRYFKMDWECFLSQCAPLQTKCHSPLFLAGRIMKESIKSSNADRKQTKIHVSLFWGSKRIRLLRQEHLYKGLFMGREKSLTDVYGQLNKAACKSLVGYLKWHNSVS